MNDPTMTITIAGGPKSARVAVHRLLKLMLSVVGLKVTVVVVGKERVYDAKDAQTLRYWADTSNVVIRSGPGLESIPFTSEVNPAARIGGVKAVPCDEDEFHYTQHDWKNASTSKVARFECQHCGVVASEEIPPPPKVHSWEGIHLEEYGGCPAPRDGEWNADGRAYFNGRWWKKGKRHDGMEVRIVSLKEASAAFSDAHFVQVGVFRDKMEDVPERCIGTLNDVLHCLTPRDWAEWVRRQQQ